MKIIINWSPCAYSSFIYNKYTIITNVHIAHKYNIVQSEDLCAG